jgi:hypothetical protein
LWNESKYSSVVRTIERLASGFLGYWRSEDEVHSVIDQWC